MSGATALSGLASLLPEIVLLAASAAALFVHLFGGRKGARAAGWTALAGIAAAGAALAFAPLAPGGIYAGNLTPDGFAAFFKALVLAAGAAAIVLSFRFFGAERYEPGEIYILLPLALIGMCTAAAASDLIALYVAFELFAVVSYVLAGIFKKDRRSSEAGIKYFFLGTLSSGFMVLGMALVYGLTGETSYRLLAPGLSAANPNIALVGMILFLGGLVFKASLVPFHMWAPDVYEGAPTPMAAFLSTAPKAAVFAVLIRALTGPFGMFEPRWTSVFELLALASMFWGNLAALGQRSLKRMLAYSSIAHAGYLAIGLAAWGPAARPAMLFYAAVYVVMNAAVFALPLAVRRKEGFVEDVDGLRGLARRSPLLAASAVVILLALVGLPPTAGFTGKYLLFAAAVDKGLILLAAAGALNSVISLFYYFRIARAMFMDEGSEADGSPKPGFAVIVVLAAAAAALLLLGILPGILTGPAAAALLSF
jgi:NADH-quinone oxidoreductase subunit N